jgi:hypothetical protein
MSGTTGDQSRKGYDQLAIDRRRQCRLGSIGMRKISYVFAMAGWVLVTLVLTALPALADPYPPPVPRGTELVRGPEAAVTAVTREVAFTGRDVTLLAVLIAALVVTGVAALLLARRRAAAATR